MIRNQQQALFGPLLHKQSIYFSMATHSVSGPEGFEPSQTILEIAVLPLTLRTYKKYSELYNESAVSTIPPQQAKPTDGSRTHMAQVPADFSHALNRNNLCYIVNPARIELALSA